MVSINMRVIHGAVNMTEFVMVSINTTEIFMVPQIRQFVMVSINMQRGIGLLYTKKIPRLRTELQRAMNFHDIELKAYQHTVSESKCQRYQTCVSCIYGHIPVGDMLVVILRLLNIRLFFNTT